MWDKIKSAGKAAKVVNRVKAARSTYKNAKAKGEVSITKELAVGVVAPGAAWLTFRGVLTQAVAAILAGTVQVVDPFVASDLSVVITEEMIDGLSLAIVGIGFVWSVFDIVRSFARTGLFPGHNSNQP